MIHALLLLRLALQLPFCLGATPAIPLPKQSPVSVFRSVHLSGCNDRSHVKAAVPLGESRASLARCPAVVAGGKLVGMSGHVALPSAFQRLAG